MPSVVVCLLLTQCLIGISLAYPLYNNDFFGLLKRPTSIPRPGMYDPMYEELLGILSRPASIIRPGMFHSQNYFPDYNNPNENLKEILSPEAEAPLNKATAPTPSKRHVQGSGNLREKAYVVPYAFRPPMPWSGIPLETLRYG